MRTKSRAHHVWPLVDNLISRRLANRSVQSEEPFIDYSAIQHLTTTHGVVVARIAYCSLRVHHYMTMRDKFTKEPIDVPFPDSTAGTGIKCSLSRNDIAHR